jgi:hypothetical protein
MTLLGVMSLVIGFSDGLNWTALGFGSFFLLVGAWNLLMLYLHQRSADKT